MGYSGGYLLRDRKRIIDSGNGLSYFSPDDDLTAVVEGLHGDCHGQHFRILHAKDDAKVSYADAEAFAALLNKEGCHTEFVGFDAGGHNIDVPLDRMDDAERRLKAYFTPF
jgi:predicted esterase